MKMLQVFRPFMTFLMIGVAVLSSCKKNGSDPEPERNKFLGTYNLNEVCTGSPYDYEVVISAGSENNEIEIKDFYYPGVNAKATVSGNNITIPPQDFAGHYQNEPVTVHLSGSGSLSENKLSIDYKASITNLGSDECTAVATKK